MAQRTARNLTRRLGVVALAVAVAAMVAVATTVASTKAGWNQTITTATFQDFVSFDLQAYESSGSVQYTMPAYDTLLAVGPRGVLLPYLAKSWTVTPSSVTFKLRSDATCPDGTKVTPLVVAQSFKRLVTVQTVVSQRSGLFGAGPYHIKADRYRGTFTFSVDKPFSPLLYSFATPFTGIVCPAGLTAVAADPNALQTGMYGSGPYTLVSATHGSQVVYKLRHNWTWGPSGTTWKDLPETLVYQQQPNQTTAANLLLTGGLNIAQITGPDVPRLQANTSLIQKAIAVFASTATVFNMAPGRVTQDIKVRQALMTALDPKAWTQAAYAGQAIPASSVFTPAMQCYDPATAKLLPKPSIPAALAILQSDGYTMNNGHLEKNGQPLTLSVLSRPLFGSSGEYEASVFQQLGITVNLAASSDTTFVPALLGGNFDVATSLYGATSFTPAPGSQLHYFTDPPPPTGFNFASTGVGDSILADYVNKANATTGKESCDWFAKAQERLISQYYLFPGAAPVNFWFGNGATFLPSATYLNPVFIRKPKS